MALILRARERAAVPWKNGGGVTRTVAVHPPGSDLETFDWRVSIAEVRSSSPFSIFSGVERHMAVLRGRLSLSIDGGAALILTADSAPLSFAGDVPAHGVALAGAVTDLNVMTRRGRCSAQILELRFKREGRRRQSQASARARRNALSRRLRVSLAQPQSVPSAGSERGYRATLRCLKARKGCAKAQVSA